MKSSRSSNKLGVIVSIVAIALCVVLITGSTFSLFTGNTESDIVISAGKIELTADLDDDTFALSSLGVAQPGTTFANGGTATLAGADLTLENITPGDKVEFDIVIDNDSTIKIAYALTWAMTGDLAQHLTVSVDDQPFAGGTSDWYDWDPTLPLVPNLKTIHVAIELPETVGDDAQTLSATIELDLDAVQANAKPIPPVLVTTPEELADALDNAEPGTVVDATGVTVTLSGNREEYLTAPAGATIKGAIFNSPPSTFIQATGDANDGDLVFEDCVFVSPGMATLGIATMDASAPNIEYNNCTFLGQIQSNLTANANAVATFNNCTFGIGSDGVGFVTCMGGTSIFNNCTFDFTGGATFGSSSATKWSAINSYSENRFATCVELNGCTLINCSTYRNHGNSSIVVN